MNMSYKFKGFVHRLKDTQTWDSGFRKREIVITDGTDKYPKEIKFEFLKDNVDLLEGLKVGQEVTVEFDLSGNEYNGNHYVNLHGTKITKHKGTLAPSVKDASDDDDIPF